MPAIETRPKLNRIAHPPTPDLIRNQNDEQRRDRPNISFNRRCEESHFHNGFTLLELLVVMVIIGLLASFVAPRYFDQIGKSEVKTARAQLDALDKALAAYRVDTGHFPDTEQGLGALVRKPSNEPKWAGSYLAKDLPLDPWGHDYVYRQPGDNGHEFELISLGRDGQVGGSGLDADLSIWDSGR